MQNKSIINNENVNYDENMMNALKFNFKSINT